MLAIAQDRRGRGGVRRQACETEGIVTQLRDFAWRQGRGELLPRGVERLRQIGPGEAVGELAEDFRRLIEPKVSDEFRGLRGMLKPGRLPGDRSSEVLALRQRFRDPPRGGVGGVGSGRLHRDDEFAGIGKVLLINFQPLHRRQVRRQQVEHLDVESKAGKAAPDWNQRDQPKPATEGFHRVR